MKLNLVISYLFPVPTLSWFEVA